MPTIRVTGPNHGRAVAAPARPRFAGARPGSVNDSTAAIVAVAILVVVGAFGAYLFLKRGDKAATATRPEAVPQVGTKVGQMAREIAGEDVDGVKFKLSDYRGKVVLLDFWGHW